MSIPLASTPTAAAAPAGSRLSWHLPPGGLEERERRDLDRVLAFWDRLGELGATVLKTNRLRTVWSVERAPAEGVDGGAPGRWIVKQYRYLGLWDRLRSRLAGGRARREHDALERLRALGFDAPRPLCWGERAEGGFPAAGGLVMEEITAADLVAERLAAAGRDAGASDSAAASRRLLVALGRLARALHDRGVHHPDLHGGNFLVDRDAPARLHVIDVHSCRFPGSVPRFLRVRGLAKVVHSLLGVLRPGELRWLLASYVAGDEEAARLERSAAEGGEPFDVIAAAAAGEARRLEQHLLRRAARLERVRLRSRTRRCLGSSTSFESVRRRGERVLRARLFPAAAARDLARVIPPGELLKATRRGWVVRCEADGRQVVVKHRRLSPLERLASVLGRHRLRRAWVAGHGLRVRGLAAPLGLALVERRRLGVVECAWLIQEAVPAGEALDAFAWRSFGPRGDACGSRSARARIAIAREAGALLRGLHDAGCRLHDASPQNVVVEVGKLPGTDGRGAPGSPGAGAADSPPDEAPPAEGHELALHRAGLAERFLWLVDLDDVTLGGRVPAGRRRRNLVQLGNLPEGHVRVADRLRALRAYDGGDGTYYDRGSIAALTGGLLDEAMRTIARMTRLELRGRPVEDAPGERRVE